MNNAATIAHGHEGQADQGVLPIRKIVHRIVDADAHVDPPHVMWREYLPKQFRDLAPYVEEGPDHDFIVFEGNRRPLKMSSNQAGRHGKDYKLYGKVSDLRVGWTPETRLADMDLDHMDAAVLFGGGPLGTKNPDLYGASFETYNRWIWEFSGADRKRLVPVAYLPTRDVEETIRMVKDVAKMGIRTVNIPAFPQSRSGLETSSQVKAIATGQGAALTGDPSGERSYADQEYDALWAVLSDLDMTVTIHLGGRIPRFGEKKYFLPDMVMSKLAMAEPVAIFIYGAIFQRFPKLRLVIAESGIGWMAWMAEYMDATWERQRFWTESPLTDKPSHFMEQNVYGSFIHDRAGVLGRNLPGGRNIMWSSDYPHSETSFPNSLRQITHDFERVPDEDLKMIICDRTAQVYSVP